MKRLALFTSAVILFFIVGCGQQLFEPHRVKNQEEAGSVHVAVVSVASWENYRTELQPQFSLSEKEALERVIPSTLALDEQFIDTLSAAFQLQLGMSGTSSTQTTTKQTGSPTTRSFTETKSKEPATMPSVSADEAKSAATAPSAKLGDKGPGVDAMLQYRAAAALYQEVKMLNHYVMDAATRRDCEAYVVRLQVTLIPSARNEPYDAYFSAALFCDRFGKEGAPIKKPTLKNPPIPQPPKTPPPVRISQLSDQASIILADAAGGQDEQKAGYSNPVVVPLLVTDDLEAMAHTRSVDVIRQYALALAGVIHGVGFGGDVKKFDERLQAVLGPDLNSTMTVGQLSENAVYARLGAMLQATSLYGMVPQNHYITLLVLVPKPYICGHQSDATLRLLTQTSMRDAVKGTQLKQLSIQDLEKRRQEIICKHFPNLGNQSAEVADSLAAAVAQNQFDTFVDILNDLAKHGQTEEKYPEVLWIDLLSQRLANQYSYASVQLPPVPQRLEADSAQLVALLDDGKSASAKIRDVKNLPSRNLGAWLEVTTDKNAGVHLVATGIEPDLGARTLTVVFPSLKKLKLTPKTLHVTSEAYSCDEGLVSHIQPTLPNDAPSASGNAGNTGGSGAPTPSTPGAAGAPGTPNTPLRPATTANSSGDTTSASPDLQFSVIAIGIDADDDGTPKTTVTASPTVVANDLGEAQVFVAVKDLPTDGTLTFEGIEVTGIDLNGKAVDGGLITADGKYNIHMRNVTAGTLRTLIPVVQVGKKKTTLSSLSILIEKGGK